MYTQREIEALDEKAYRESYLEDQVKSYVAYQIKAARESLGLTQAEFALKIGKPQSVVSRLESLNYGKMRLQTLLEMANVLDVALVVRFVSFPEFLNIYEDVTASALQAEPYNEEKPFISSEESSLIENGSQNINTLEIELDNITITDYNTAVGFGETSYMVNSIVVGSQTSLVSGVAVTPFLGLSVNLPLGRTSYE